MSGPMPQTLRATLDPDRRRIGAHASFCAVEQIMQRAVEAVGGLERLRPEFVDTLPPGVPGLGEIDNRSIGR